jgi:glutamate 5-kinase
MVGGARPHGLKSGQILLTLGDTEERRRYLNARATIGTLLKMKARAGHQRERHGRDHEIRYGDNDRLAARVATMMGADLLVLLSDIDGLYTAPPARTRRGLIPRRRRASRPRSRRWPAARRRNCRAAACAPRSTPARSPRLPARR